MKNYYKTEMPDYFEVKSLILIHYVDSYTHLEGEIHNFPELVYVNKGTHILEVNGISYELKEGQMFLIPSNEFHYAPIPGASLAIISFEADGETFANLYHHIITLTPSQRDLLYDIISKKYLFETIKSSTGYIGKKPTESTTRQELQVLKNLLENFLLDILYAHKEAYSSPQKLNEDHHRISQLNQIKDFMKHSIGKSLTLSEISKFTGISVTKINLLFKDYDKMPPMAYFTFLKMEEAKRLIQKTELNFTEIASQLGYESIHYFSKVFKKYTGLSPSDFSRKIIS